MRRSDTPFSSFIGRLTGRSGRLPTVVLLMVLLGALWLRLAGIRFGLPALNDPDELMFEMGALRMLRGPTLNPGWFGHPATTTMYVLALTNVATLAVVWVGGWATSARQFVEMAYADPSWMILPGRLVMMAFALASIVLTAGLARRFFGPVAGVVAAALLAVNPVHVTYSQIIRTDMMACVFMLLCLRASVLVAVRGNWRAYLAAAAWLGIAIATKWPFALSGLAIAGATAVAVENGVLDRRVAIVRLLVAAIVAIGVLLLVSPYLLLDYPTVLRNIRGEGQVAHLGATGGSPWFNLRWYATGPILAGFGVMGLILLAIGVVRTARHRLALAILAPVAVAFAGLLCVQYLVWERWALPLMPIGTIVAAGGLTGVASRLRGRQASWVIAAVLIVALVPLGARAVADNRMRMNDTRQIASAWARRHIPPGSTVLVEHFAFDILAEPWRFLFPLGDRGCVDVRAYLRGKVGYQAIEQGRGARSNIDYGTVAPSARPTCRADIMIATQFDRYAQERSRFPVEYAAYRSLADSGRIVATFTPQSGQVGGPVVTIIDLRR